MAEKLGIMICGHGSRNMNAVKEFATVVADLQKMRPDMPVEYGYLEFAKPLIKQGLDKLRDKKVNKILAIPGMLFAAGHAKNDIPSVLNSYQAKYPDIKIFYGRELGIDIKMIRASNDRIQQAITKADTVKQVSLHDTLLMVVGRGASDPDANSNVSKLMRILWEGTGIGWGEVSYSGVTFPLIKPGLEHAAKLGYKRIIVFPYFLFTGVLVKRIYAHTDEIAVKYPEIEFVKASYLNNHPLIIKVFSERADEILNGSNLMNCQMCKYREQVPGFESEVGLAQKSHHHHVEGIGSGVENCPCKGDCDASCRNEDFCLKHGLVWTPLHNHSHSHHSYPHADHPLGPASVRK